MHIHINNHISFSHKKQREMEYVLRIEIFMYHKEMRKQINCDRFALVFFRLNMS